MKGLDTRGAIADLQILLVLVKSGEDDGSVLAAHVVHLRATSTHIGKDIAISSTLIHAKSRVEEVEKALFCRVRA